MGPAWMPGLFRCCGDRERLKPPQRLRKAPQTAWGFNCLNSNGLSFRGSARRHSPVPQPPRATEESSRPIRCSAYPHRIPPPAARSPPTRAAPRPHRTCRRRPTSRGHSREFIRRGWVPAPNRVIHPRPRDPRKLAQHPAPPDPSAQADIAGSQPRIHSPGLGARPLPDHPPGPTWPALVLRPPAPHSAPRPRDLRPSARQSTAPDPSAQADITSSLP
jgi:hypothetical protein